MDSLKTNELLQLICVSIVLWLILCMLALHIHVPAYFRAPPTSAQPICLLLEMLLYWKVSFDAPGLSVLWNSGVVRYLGAVNVLNLWE